MRHPSGYIVLASWLALVLAAATLSAVVHEDPAATLVAGSPDSARTRWTPPRSETLPGTATTMLVEAEPAPPMTVDTLGAGGVRPVAPTLPVTTTTAPLEQPASATTVPSGPPSSVTPSTVAPTTTVAEERGTLVVTAVGASLGPSMCVSVLPPGVPMTGGDESPLREVVSDQPTSIAVAPGSYVLWLGVATEPCRNYLPLIGPADFTIGPGQTVHVDVPTACGVPPSVRPPDVCDLEFR